MTDIPKELQDIIDTGCEQMRTFLDSSEIQELCNKYVGQQWMLIKHPVMDAESRDKLTDKAVKEFFSSLAHYVLEQYDI